MRTCKERNRGSWHHACTLHLSSRFAQSGSYRRCNPGARFTCVAPENHAWSATCLAQGVAQRQPSRKNCLRIQRIFTRHSANSVSAEKLPCSRCAHRTHFFFVLIFLCAAPLFSSTRLKKSPSPKRVVTRSPNPSCPTERINVPSAPCTSADRK